MLWLISLPTYFPIIITAPEPTAVADVYGIIKVPNQKEKVREFYLIVNKVQNRVFESIRIVCEKFTSAEVKYLGSIEYNSKMIRSIINQNPFEEGFTEELTNALLRLLLGIKPQATSFWDRLISKIRRSS